MNKFVKWLMQTSLWTWALKAINNLEYRISGGTPSFAMSDYHKIVDMLSLQGSGPYIYTFATADQSSPISTAIRKLTGGDFNHAGFIFTDVDGLPYAFHVTTKGLVIEDLLEVLRDTDYICINKLELTDENYKKAIQRREHLRSLRNSIKYDYSITLNDTGDKFYCSEASFFILDGLYYDVDLKPEIIYGRKVFSPYKVTKLGKVIYNNHPNFTGESK